MTTRTGDEGLDAELLPTRDWQDGSRSGVGATFAMPEEVRRLLTEAFAPEAERFEHEAEIGHGGMGTVEAAADRPLRRRVAMKVIHPEGQRDPQRVRMFLREARITGRLGHPGTVPVHQVGLDERGRLYFTMKLVEGATLAQLVREREPGPLEHGALLNFLEVVVKVCDALAFAHSRGILHCDIKPANVMVGDFGQVYLMDWGLARPRSDPEWLAPPDPSAEVATDRAVDAATRDSIVGTVGYMSPEQARGDNDRLSPRSDVFSVGALLYEVLTRRSPFKGRGVALLMAQECAYPTLEDVLGPGVVPSELARIVARAMAPEPAVRYATAGELRDDLVRFMRGGGQFPQRRFAPGEPIVREGEVGDAAFIIASGRCEVYREVDGKQVLLRTMERGEVFGETAVLSPGLRTASVVAVDAVTVHVVTREVLEREVDATKPWLGAFIRTLASRFRQREEGARDSMVGEEGPPDPARVARLALMVMSTWGTASPEDAAVVQLPLARFASELRSEPGAGSVEPIGVVERLGFALEGSGEDALVQVRRARLDELRAAPGPSRSGPGD